VLSTFYPSRAISQAPKRRTRMSQVSASGLFRESQGAEVGVYIQVTRLNAQWANSSWWEASYSLALDLLNINP